MGTCVAGKELIEAHSGQWVRPVSHRPKQEVTLCERQFADGSEPRLLDIIEVPVRYHCPNLHQMENWLLDPGRRWVWLGRVEWDSLFSLRDTPRMLWINGSRTRFGLNDRIRLSKCGDLNGSLYFLHLRVLKLHVFPPAVGYGKAWLRVHAQFTYAGTNYKMWVTDPVIEATYRAKGEGIYKIGECFVTVSLGEPHEDGYCYKLVAAVMTP